MRAYHVARVGGEWMVTNNTETDSLTNVEKAVVDGQTTWLVDTTAELTYALANAVDGDIVQLAPGNYVGTFTVDDKQLTILGANAGRTATRLVRPESIIKGHLVLNGTKAVQRRRRRVLAPTARPARPAWQCGSAAAWLGHYTIENSVFFNATVRRQHRGDGHHDRHLGVGPCRHRRQLLHRPVHWQVWATSASA